MAETTRERAGRQVNWAGVAACCVSAYTLALQNNAMNVAGPVLAREFGVSVADAATVTLAYTVPITATLIAAGRIGDVFGARRVFWWGMALYLVGSTVAGAAPGLAILLVVRFLQSFGATAVVSNQLGLAARSTGGGRKGEVFGLINFMAYAGQVSGPVVGGLVAGLLGWRFLFWVNTPLALGIILWGIPRIAPDTRDGGSRSLDLKGAGLFACAIGALLIALNRSPAWGPTSPAVVTLVVVAAIAGWFFLAHERQTDEPMLDLTLFRSRTFSAAVGSSMANYVANAGLVLLLPFYLVEGQGLGVEQAGIAMVPLSILMALFAPISGRLGDRLGPRLPSTLGMLILGASVGVLALLPSYLSVPWLMVLLVGAGIGIGLFSSANTISIMGAVSEDRVGVAGGLVNTARYVGLTGGVALAGALYTIVEQHDAGLGALFAYRVSFAVLALIAVAGAIASGLREEPRATYGLV